MDYYEYYQETRDELRKLMEQHQDLTSDGWGYARWGTYDASRTELLNAVRNVERARAWFSKFSKTKTPNRKFSSYILKHLLEKESGYVTNGEAIAGAMLAGFAPTSRYDSLNCFFNISSRELKRHIRETPKLAEAFKDLV